MASSGVNFGICRIRIERDDAGDRRELYRRALGLPDPELGTLDLGSVRDSTINSGNDYQVFAEAFENSLVPGANWVASWSTADD